MCLIDFWPVFFFFSLNELMWQLIWSLGIDHKHSKFKRMTLFYFLRNHFVISSFPSNLIFWNNFFFPKSHSEYWISMHNGGIVIAIHSYGNSLDYSSKRLDQVVDNLLTNPENEPFIRNFSIQKFRFTFKFLRILFNVWYFHFGTIYVSLRTNYSFYWCYAIAAVYSRSIRSFRILNR